MHFRLCQLCLICYFCRISLTQPDHNAASFQNDPDTSDHVQNLTTAAPSEQNDFLKSLSNFAQVALRNVIDRILSPSASNQGQNYPNYPYQPPPNNQAYPPYNRWGPQPVDESGKELLNGLVSLLPNQLTGRRLQNCPRCQEYDEKKLTGNWQLIYASDNFIKSHIEAMVKQSSTYVSSSSLEQPNAKSGSSANSFSESMQQVLTPLRLPTCMKWQIGQSSSSTLSPTFQMQYTFRLGTAQAGLRFGYGIIQSERNEATSFTLYLDGGRYPIKFCLLNSNLNNQPSGNSTQAAPAHSRAAQSTATPPTSAGSPQENRFVDGSGALGATVITTGTQNANVVASVGPKEEIRVNGTSGGNESALGDLHQAGPVTSAPRLATNSSASSIGRVAGVLDELATKALIPVGNGQQSTSGPETSANKTTAGSGAGVTSAVWTTPSADGGVHPTTPASQNTTSGAQRLGAPNSRDNISILESASAGQLDDLSTNSSETTNIADPSAERSNEENELQFNAVSSGIALIVSRPNSTNGPHPDSLPSTGSAESPSHNLSVNSATNSGHIPFNTNTTPLFLGKESTQQETVVRRLPRSPVISNFKPLEQAARQEPATSPLYMILTEVNSLSNCQNFLVFTNDEQQYLQSYDNIVTQQLRLLEADTDANPLQYIGCPRGVSQ